MYTLQSCSRTLYTQIMVASTKLCDYHVRLLASLTKTIYPYPAQSSTLVFVSSVALLLPFGIQYLWKSVPSQPWTLTDATSRHHILPLASNLDHLPAVHKISL